MNREIKFRAWLVDLKKMETGLFGMRSDGLLSFNSEAILMQYTGLKDKNGKDIYEGDIIKGQFKHYDPMLDDWMEDEKMGGIVFWDLYGWRIKVIESICEKERDGMVNYFDFSINGVYWAAKEFEDIEVIGNIYENPELL